MNRRFIIAIVIVCVTVSYLVYSSVSATAKSVVTVAELLKGGPRANIRVGARVADRAIEQLAPQPNAAAGEGSAVSGIQFAVRDIQGDPNEIITVQYHHVMPENLKAGRDVIIEGQYSDGKFEAKTLLTQCPSKYVPPTPGAGSSGAGQSGSAGGAYSTTGSAGK